MTAMETKKLQAATIVASPSAFCWSQAYNAGNLFAVLAIQAISEEKAGENLGILGKEFFNSLEAEYFTLETKNLATIKEAIRLASEKLTLDEQIQTSLVIASLINNVLYVFGQNHGKVFLKRNDKLGTILDAKGSSFSSASGFLQDNDGVVLATDQFNQLVSPNTLKDALSADPSEAAETLSLKVHNQEEGGASAVIFNYKEPQVENSLDAQTLEETPQKKLSPLFGKILAALPTLHLPLKINIFQHTPALNHRKKVFLTVACMLAVALILSIGFTLKRQVDEKTKTLFNQIVVPAQKKIEEGENLVDLNKNLARDDFMQAQKLLAQGKSKFSKGSNEQKQIDELLRKVNEKLSLVSGIQSVQATAVEADKSILLATETKNSSALSFTQDEKNVYGIDQNSIFSIDKKNQTKKTIIKNDNFWSSPAGLGVYSGYPYVLDKKIGQVLKFVSAASPANYFSSAQDLSKAASLSIDGSVWILFQDGNIKKFTKGKVDEFVISGLDTLLANPTKIFTNIDTNNVYVLDNGNKRIVVFGKNGAYQTQYQAEVIKNAVEFEVLENKKVIYFLSSGKIFEIPIK